jgi:hypothetical protein
MCANDLFVPGCCRRSNNKGIGVDNMHYLNDGLWKVCPPFVLCIWLAFLMLAYKDVHRNNSEKTS